MKLEDTVAIVTGGAAGIGEAIAKKFGREGAAVFVADLPGSRAQQIVDAITSEGGRAACFTGDLSDETTAKACVEAAVNEFGKIDVLASNAGILIQSGEIDTCSIEDFDRTMRVNTRSAFLMTKFAVPHLKKTRGAIVYTGSITAIVGAGEIAAYAGSKGFIHAFMMAVAMEQAKHGIRVNVVAPGAVSTAMISAEAGAVISPEMEEATSAGAAMGRQGNPEEIANVAAFLASADASYVTGAVYVADGGVVPAQGAPGTAVPRELRRRAG